MGMPEPTWWNGTPRQYLDSADDDTLTPEEELAEYLDSLGLDDIQNAPKDGSPFRAVLEDGEHVTARYRVDYRHYLGEDSWYDDEGDGASDGHCRTWWAEDFAGWLPPAEIAAEMEAV